MQPRKESSQRELSGKAHRYEQATEKYKLFQQKKDKINQMDSILTGKSQEVFVPKPGEFFVVSNNQQTFSNKRLLNPSFGGNPDGTLMKSQSQQLKPLEAKSLTSKYIESVMQNKNGRFKQGQSPVKNVQTLPPLSNPTITMSLREDLNRRPLVSQSTKDWHDQSRGDLNGLLEHQASLDIRLKDTIRSKQDQLLQNPNMRTSMTTNIRNIMGSYDKGMLTASSRLLHAEVKFQEQEIQKQQSPQRLNFEEALTTNKSVSTLDLLRRQKYRGRQHPGELQTLSQLMPQARQMLSDPLDGMQSTDLHTDRPIQKSPLKQLNRPTSSLIMNVGEQDQVEMVKDKLDIQNARKRDHVQASSHSYQIKNQNSVLNKKWKDSAGTLLKPGSISTINSRIKPPPVLVQYQQALINEKNGVSPFLQETDSVSQIINEPAHPLGVSQSVKIIPGMMLDAFKPNQPKDNRASQIETLSTLQDEEGPLKYSNSIQQLKTLQGQKEEQPQRYLRKGTALYLKDMMERQNNNARIFMKSPPRASAKQAAPVLPEDKKMFLPVEAFDPMLDVEDPFKIIEQFKDPATGMTIAYSKWNYPNGEAELRKCVVETYIKEKDLYEIIWTHNTSIKKRVSRFNLIFDREDRDIYERRMAEAHKMREHAEILMKYHFAIDSTVLPKMRTSRYGQQTVMIEPQLIDTVKTRISYLIATFKPFEQVIKNRVFKNPLNFFARGPTQRYEVIFFVRWQEFSRTHPQDIVDQVLEDMTKHGYNLQLLASLFNDLNADFIRLHKQIWFDFQLPFDKEKYLTFKDVLPASKFIPIQDQIIDETDRTGIISIPQRAFPFQELLQTMSTKLHQGNLMKLDVLKMASNMKHNISSLKMLHFDFSSPIEMEGFFHKHKLACSEVIKTLQDNIFDCEYEVAKILNQKQIEIDKLNFELQRNMTHNRNEFVAQQIPQEFIEDLKKFQRVLQYSFENSMREVFISSVDTVKHQLRFALKELEESSGVQFYSDEDQDPDFSISDLRQVQTVTMTQTGIKIMDDNQALNLSHECQLTDSDLIKMTRDAVLQTRIIRAKCFQLQVSLVFNKEQIVISPSPLDWVNKIVNQLNNSLASLRQIKCILQAKLEPVHSDTDGSQVFLPGDPYPQREIEMIAMLYKALFQVPQSLAFVANQYSSILTEDKRMLKKKWKSAEVQVEQYKEVLDEFKRQRQEIEVLLYEDNLQLGTFIVEVGKLRKKLLERLDENQKLMMECVTQKVINQTKQLEEEVDQVLEILGKEKWENIEEVDETRRFVLKIQDKYDMLRQIQRDIQHKTDFLDANQSKMTEEQIASMWQSFAKPQEIMLVQSDCLERLDQHTVKYAEELKTMQDELAKLILQISKMYEDIQSQEELVNYEQVYRKCEETSSKLYNAETTAETCNRREALFGLPKSDFSNIRKLDEQFQPHYELWQLAQQYFRNKSIWMQGPIAELDGQQLPKDIIEAEKRLIKLSKGPFRDTPYTKDICNNLRAKYGDMKPYLPIITALKNPDFKMRHFDHLRKIRDPPFEIEHDLQLCLNDLERMGVMEFIQEITEISEIATKERKLESQLTKMRDEWKSVKLSLKEYGVSETYILEGVQPIWDLLDEHIQKTMLIASSPFAKFFIQDVLYWKQTLVKVQEILEEWSKTQRGWCYLWPIFMSPDIQNQLPDVYTQFLNVDTKWRQTMNQTQATPNVLECANQFKAYENFVHCNDTLEKVTKSLNEYLHSKQLKFPRFFFLSNDDLLHILSQTKEPVRVQDHLNKCFEGITRLNFEPETENIKGMYSAFGEYIEFDKAVEPWVAPQQVRQPKAKSGEPAAREVRPIESWLLEVEDMMRNSLRTSIIQGAKAFHAMNKADWIFQFPQQTILVLDQIFWTNNIEAAIQVKSQEALKKAHQAEERKLQELVSLIQQPRQDRVAVMTLETLIVTDVHSMDVTGIIAQQNVQNTSEFEWISQLRHYQVEEESARIRRLEVKISMINSTRYYGFEYQGNQTRLVITPLTDRCYRTLMGALQLNLGGAPEGPAGTGKTETTKDLAKALAKQCLVFNCSDQLDVQTMGKFFTGLACCGAWACFDEFNRIDLEVLSVIASQILQIQTALMRKTPNTPFQFEDEKILMNASCAVFITMNPGYAGRSELPDNLKALFRPVAMMIPNYEMIAEISLYSYGFQKARDLSVKIVQSLRLSSEQLSTQSHYDYGMRAVKSIILAAGVLKRRESDLEESKLVLRAITDCNVPKFINEDINLFGGIIQDLFPSTDKERESQKLLQDMILQSINARNLKPNAEFELKTVQLYETVQVRHGLMLVGGAMGGKTQISNTLADAQSRISKMEFLKGKEKEHDYPLMKKLDNQRLGCPQVRIHRMNPKSVSIGQLYGDFEKVSRDWQDGILATAVKESAACKANDTHWIMLDGPVDAVWIENLNTVLDDNKKLCLISGEIVKFTEQMKMMFEVEDLNEASPATVSRCGMVYVSPDKLGWQVLTHSWVEQLPDELKRHGICAMYVEMIDAIIPEVMDFLFGKNQSSEEDIRIQSLKPIVQTSKIWQFKSFLNMFEALLLGKERKQALIEKQKEEQAAENESPSKVIHAKSKEQAKTTWFVQPSKTNTLDDDSEEKTERPVKVMKQEYFDLVDSAMINHNIQLFIMALIWGFGAPLLVGAREKYSAFVQGLIQQHLTDNCNFKFKKRLKPEVFPKHTLNLFDFFYCLDKKETQAMNIDQMKWLEWTFDINKYDICGDIINDKKPVQEVEDDDEKSGSHKHSSPNSKRGGASSPFAMEDFNTIEYSMLNIVTEDTLKHMYLLEQLVCHNFPIMLMGETGTGKTQVIKKFLSRIQTDKGMWEIGEMVMSATTSAHQVQEYTFSKLEKHKKGVYGPKNPSATLVIFIDDLGMPAKEKYGAQPSLEMLRQIIDHGGFYRGKGNQWHSVINQMYLCAMGLPGGGRSLPTMRLLRHFHLLHVPELSRPTMKRIFTKILEWGMTRHNQSWKRQITTITDITIDCYQRTVKTLLPTPAKSHYVFNLRQVSEIIQGILFVDYMTVEKQQDKLSMLKRLWLHECMRVFSDRLTNDKDRKLFISECLNNKEDQSFIDFEKLGNPEDITFCNFVKFVPGEETFYEESQNTIDLRQTLGDVLQRYNDSRAPKDKMNILFFEYMIQHLSRASRIIMKPQGNGLLIGLTGNGRRSVSKLAIFLNACSQFSIDLHKNYGLNEWQEDLRNFFKTLGIDNKLTVFVFSDKDIKEEIFFEDIDSMLNVGELNNLFNSEDLEEIQYEIEKQLKRTRGVKRTPMEVFKKRCKKNFHLLLLMSPAGNKLQLYFRKYPSLVNCTSIDWYLAWPDAALLTVSEQYLIPVHNVIYESQQYEKDADPKKKADGKKLTAIPEDEENPISDRNSVDLNSDQKPSEKDDLEEFLDVEQERIKKMSVNERVSAIMTMIHQKQIELASEFQSVKRKHVYVTPLMFAGMFKTLQKLLDRKNKAIEEERGKYTQGILKLEEAKVMIDEMQMQLEKLKPVLESKKKQVDATMKRLEQESRKVEATEQIVKKEEAEVKEQRDEADSIKNDCQARLAIAEPHFTAAINALRCLSQNDFTVIKSFTNPPAGVRLALEACCVMLGLKGQAVRIDNKKVIDFWDVSKKAVTNYKKLIDQLENYPKEDVSPEIIKKIQPYLSNPDFQPEKIKQASEAAEGICKWVIAICKFDIVYKEITPKRIALEQANEKLKIVSQKLADKQAELQIIIDQKTQLELEFKQQNQEKEDLLFQRDQAQKKLDRASKLISSIGSERDRWVSTKAKLGEAKRSLLGDMVIASAIISYLGPFDGKYRSIAVREMGMLCRKYNIEFSYNYSLKGVIANEEEVTDWLIKGLPNEQVCVDNMIIVSECKETHYPVLIDPQGQALKFLQQFTQTGEPVVQMKITQPNAAYLLQHALQEGFKVIVENASEVTNTSLLSILRRETQTSVGTSLMIKFNDQQIEFDRHFYCYILSQYTTPHFQPEVQQLSKVLDFSVTREGLEQQLLQIVCKSESAKEEDEREKLTKQGLLFTQQKKQIVNDILDTLRNSGKNILESDDLVNKLESSKQLTNEINHKLNVARHIEERIEENRKIFKPVAEHGARLYFAVQDLPLLDPMYQFSMKWFKDLFDSCFVIEGEEKKEEEKAEEHSFNDDVTPPTRTKKALNKQRGRQEPVKTKEMKMQRVIQLKKDFREILYKNVCMSLFETHKLLFAFYMSLKIFEQGEQAESFAEKLKALDKLNEESAKLYDSSSKQSDDLVNMKASTIKKNTESRRGGSRVGMDERVLIPKEDEKLKINEDLLNFTLTGLLPRGMKIYGSDKNPDPSVFSEKMWKELEVLTAFDCFESLQEEITKNLPAWRQFIAADQESVFDLLPEPYHSQLTYFALIPLMRILRPELTTATIRRYVQSSLGQFFVQPIIFQVNDIVEQSKVYTPMLLLLTPGNDPMEAIKKAAEERGKVPNPISLGKGQGDKAKRVIQESKKYESWIVLQNCHLAASFLPDLEQIIENLQPQKNKANMPDQQMSGGKKEKEEAPPHPGFRIWLTSMSIDYFPQSILYNSIKITSEPPKGIKAAMLRQYGMIASNKAEKQTYEANQQPEKWRTLFLSLSFFHAVVRERRRFGPLGWTKLYDFNDSDFRISMRQLYIMVEEFEEVPFTALQYLTGDCNYGGRVTDDRDRIALTAILKDFYTEKTYKTESYAFAGEQNAKYKIFNAPTIKEYLDYINSLPDDESPELMGLHENANISQAIYEASQIFANVLKLGQTSNAEGTSSNQEQCRTMTLEILDKIREPFKIKEVEAIYPFRYEESMNSVLLQELARFNKLIEIIKGSLQTLLKTLDGKFVTTAEIEALKASILSNVIPERWKKASYQSRKPLLSYVTDLQQRLEMLEHWIKNGKPNVFWISGFFFTQSFLTGIKQNFARRFNHPIDLVEFRFEILKYADAKKAENEPPQFGCFLQGLFLEGASWEDMHGCLEESKRGEMFVSMPIINFVPKLVAPSQTQEQLPCDTNGSTHGFHYACPTYKTGERYGTLLTTGHSTNYVMNISLPSKVEPEHWVKRSVALLMQLDT